MVSIILTAVLSTVAFWFVFTNQEKSDLKMYAQTVAHAYNVNNDNYNTEFDFNNVRITLINPQGKVIFDSYTEVGIDAMENHSDRPEFIDAIKNGKGASNRMSETLNNTTYYYAVKTNDGNVLRVSKTIGSVFEIFVSVLPLILISAGAVFLFCLLMSKHSTKKLIEPIKQMSDNLDKTAYEELVPLAETISSQQKEIRKQIRRLQLEKDRISTLIQNMSEGFILLDTKQNVLMSNHSAFKLIGLEPNSDIDFNSNDTVRESVESALNGNGRTVELAINDRMLQIITNPVYSNGKQKGVICLIIDISAKKKAEKMRREFTANVTHELKTPLTSISGYAEIISSGLARPDDVQGFAKKIQKESGRLLSLIGDIIELSQLDEGATDEQITEVELSGVAYEVAEDLRSNAEKHGVTTSVVESEKVKIKGSRNRIYELVYNLCDNAIRYNRPNGQVKITVKSEDGVPTIRVADTGIGIPQKYRKRVFERFFRVDKSRSKETGGTGLGLAIVKHIAELYGGNVTLKSSENGTTFIVKFSEQSK